MSATSPTAPGAVPSRNGSAAAQPPGLAGGVSQRRRLRSGLVSAGVLCILLVGLVLAIPGLGAVGHRVAHAHLGWVIAGAGLELASCAGYVLAFQGIFKESRPALERWWRPRSRHSGLWFPSAVPAASRPGGWLLSRAGMPPRVIAERSAVLFLLTSATNVVALVLAGAGLAIGVFAGPRDLALSALPAGVGLAVLILFLGLARRASGRTGAGASLASRALGATAGASATTLRAVRRPGWRLAVGALAFLLCDIAVLWLAIHALGYDVPVAPLLLAYLIGYLANAIPIPGGVGVLDGGLAGALLLYHVPAPAAVGGVLLYHALALWIPALSGTAGFIAAQRQINMGGVRAALASASSGSGLATSPPVKSQESSTTRKRPSPSAGHQTCRPRLCECG
jgi:hypothetical protein